jgi:hypothetical protein
MESRFTRGELAKPLTLSLPEVTANLALGQAQISCRSVPPTRQQMVQWQKPLNSGLPTTYHHHQTRHHASAIGLVSLCAQPFSHPFFCLLSRCLSLACCVPHTMSLTA